MSGMEKQCFKCLAVKPFTEFYRHKMMADGYLNKCKVCAKSDVSLHRTENLDRIRAYDRLRHDNDAHRERNKRNYRKRISDPERKVAEWGRSKQWAEQNVLKRAAHILVGNAIRKGTLIPKPCERCGHDEGVHGHHEDYERPLDVVWLCKPCHGKRHREINEQRRKTVL